MAIPENRTSIHTNLPEAQLDKFLDNLEADQCTQVPGSGSLYEGSRGGLFIFEEATYSISEYFELLRSAHLVSGTPAFIQSLIDDLELQLTEIVNKRDYDAAKLINNKITDLKRILAKQPVL